MPGTVVRDFIEKVRSGKEIEKAHDLLAEVVEAHQIVSGAEVTLIRSPQDYIDHVQEFIDIYGVFELSIDEFLVSDEKVYVRWTQTGKHLKSISGYEPTGNTITAIGSAVYRVSNNRIVEYWIQQENSGLHQQLESASPHHLID